MNGYHPLVTAPQDAAAEARKIPRADRLLAAAGHAGLIERMGHAPIMEAVRAALDELRTAVLAGAPCPPAEEVEAALLSRLAAGMKGTLRRVVNATGVVLHTNLGRAPLSRGAIAAMQEAAGYSNLEFDLASGERGDRYDHATAASAPVSRQSAAAAWPYRSPRSPEGRSNSRLE